MLTPELVAHQPRPGLTAPGKFAFSPSGRYLTYLFSERGGMVRELWALDVQTGERECWAAAAPGGVSREEDLLAQRQKSLAEGVTDYSWARDRDVLVTVVGGELRRWSEGSFQTVATQVTDSKLSAGGSRIFFVRDQEVWCLEGSQERRLTSGSQPGVSNGIAEFAAQEELDRYSGHWPSPDGGLLAYAQVDERAVPLYTIVHQGTDELGVEEHRYPFAGAANAAVRLGIMPAEGGETTWLQPEIGDGAYLARVDWSPDSRLFVQVLSRDQRSLELRAYEGPSWRGVLLLGESAESWVNLHDELRFIEASGEFLWASERSGFKHLYLHDGAGKLLRQLTEGAWPVDAVRGLDPARRVAYFTAGKESPLQAHVYRVALEGGEPEALTSGAGIHDAVFSHDCSLWVEASHSRQEAPGSRLRSTDGSTLQVVHAPDPGALELRPPELDSFQADDGTTLYAALYRPSGVERPPLIVSVYGGPQVQEVTEGWDTTIDLRAQLLAERGYMVLQVDNRGSARRGHAFEAAILGNMGDLEVRDQVAGVRWLAQRGLIDESRVGIYGGSYGGYMSAMALVKAPEVFKVGVALAPVSNWDGYDTAYTERYMRTPQANPEGYRRSSVMTHVEALRGDLLLMHGLLDENVHFRHSARLMQALIEAGKPYEVLLYPNERHLPRHERDRVAMETRILEFFQRHL